MTTPGPLDGAVLIELTDGIAGSYCAKLFADFGAEVIKIEPLAGDSLRRVGPWHEGIAGPERSGTFFYFNTNKRSLSLDLRHERAGAVFDRLIDRASLVIEALAPGELDSLGLGWERIRVSPVGLAAGFNLPLWPGIAVSRLPGVRPGAVRICRRDVLNRGPGPGAGEDVRHGGVGRVRLDGRRCGDGSADGG